MAIKCFVSWEMFESTAEVQPIKAPNGVYNVSKVIVKRYNIRNCIDMMIVKRQFFPDTFRIPVHQDWMLKWCLSFYEQHNDLDFDYKEPILIKCNDCSTGFYVDIIPQDCPFCDGDGGFSPEE